MSRGIARFQLAAASLRARDTRRLDLIVRHALALEREREACERVELRAMEKGTLGRLRVRTYLFFEDASTSQAAVRMSWLMMATIVLSVVAFVLESLPSIEHWPIFVDAEVFFVAVFTFEYVGRFLCSPLSTYAFVASPLNVVDLLSILPLLVELLYSVVQFDIMVVRVVRLLRLFRILKMVRHMRSFQVASRSLALSLEALVLASMYVMLAALFVAALMIAPEGREELHEHGLAGSGRCYARSGEDLCSPFESIPLGLYWAITTLTSTGYGEVVPLSTGGRAIASFAMVVGVIAVCFPIIVLTVRVASRQMVLTTNAKAMAKMLQEDKEHRDAGLSAKPMDVQESMLEIDRSLKEFESLRDELMAIEAAALHSQGRPLGQAQNLAQSRAASSSLGVETGLDHLRQVVAAEIAENRLSKGLAVAEVTYSVGRSGRSPTATPRRTPRMRSNLDKADAIFRSSPQTTHDKARLYVYRLFESYRSSRTAFACAVYFSSCVLCSCTLLIAGTMPSLMGRWEWFFFSAECYFVATFTVEYILRLWSSPLGTSHFCFEPFNFIDLAAIAPFYVEALLMAVEGHSVVVPLGTYEALRLFRLVRLLRIFRFAKYSDTIRSVLHSLTSSRNEFALLICLCVAVLTAAGALQMAVERGTWDPAEGCYVRRSRPDLGCSPFASIPHSFYWGITTITTVGYGDVYPVTPAGQTVACMTMLVGLLVIALPVAMLSESFVSAMRATEESRVLDDIDSRMLQPNAVIREQHVVAVDTVTSYQRDLASLLQRLDVALLAAEGDGPWHKLYTDQSLQITENLQLVVTESERRVML